MKKMISIALVLWGFIANAQTYVPPMNTSCNGATEVCGDSSFYYDDSGISDDRIVSRTCRHNPFVLWYKFYQSSPGNVFIGTNSPDTLLCFTLYGPFPVDMNQACGSIASNSAAVIENHTTPFTNHTFNGNLQQGMYIFLVKPKKCRTAVSFIFEGSVECLPEPPATPPCENCIGSFSPIPGKKYLLSAWVKEDGAPPTKTSYTEPQIFIDFPSCSSSAGPFTPTGQIIDGWQRIESEFIMQPCPNISIRLNVLSGNAFFDDIRVFPFDGSMVTYVFDPVSLRLVAQLDERNYATIYEYDEEGKLVRVKKETERGVMTIEENKTSMKKQ